MSLTDRKRFVVVAAAGAFLRLPIDKDRWDDDVEGIRLPVRDEDGRLDGSSSRTH